MKWMLLVTGAVLACADPPRSQTGMDAESLGYKLFDCPSQPVESVYGKPPLSAEEACPAVAEALRLARGSDLAPGQALHGDSLLLAVVERDRFGEIPSRPGFPGAGLAVTLDLVLRTENLLVAWPGLDEAFDISWAPEGLKY